MLVGGGLPDARGHQQITRLATRLWRLDRSYLADPRRILQVGDTALVLGGRAINVVRRDDSGSWRYSIAFLQGGGGDRKPGQHDGYLTVGMPAMAAGVSWRRSGTTRSAARTSSGGGG
jgi:hypothetical protein